jgi:hypothetical protein
MSFCVLLFIHHLETRFFLLSRIEGVVEQRPRIHCWFVLQHSETRQRNVLLLV